VLRRSVIKICGTAGIPAREVLVEALDKVLGYAASGELQIETLRVPLAEIESAWLREDRGRRMVIIP